MLLAMVRVSGAGDVYMGRMCEVIRRIALLAGHYYIYIQLLYKRFMFMMTNTQLILGLDVINVSFQFHSLQWHHIKNTELGSAHRAGSSRSHPCLWLVLVLSSCKPFAHARETPHGATETLTAAAFLGKRERGRGRESVRREGKREGGRGGHSVRREEGVGAKEIRKKERKKQKERWGE